MLTVSRRGGWRAWGSLRGAVERSLAEVAVSAVAAIGSESETRRGADFVRVVIVAAVDAADAAGAFDAAWDAFREAAAADRLVGSGWRFG